MNIFKVVGMDQLFKNKGAHTKGVFHKKTFLKKQVLKSIYFGGPQSNSDLAKSLNLSIPNINGLVNDLIKDNLVEDLGQGESSGGRRPNIYGLVKDGFYLVGINTSLYRTGISIFNTHNEELREREYYPIRITQGFEIFDEINEKLNLIIGQSGIDKNKIIAIGIEVPGLVNQEKGMNITYFPGKENLINDLQEIFNYPVYFENNAKVRTFSEQQFGIAKGLENVLVVNVGWGIGLGIISTGYLYSGKTGFSGEFGHLPVVDNGTLCKCGKRGCLETVASLTAIVQMVREGLQSSKSSALRKIIGEDLENINIDTVVQAAQNGDELSAAILTNVGHWLGRGIAYLLQIFNPELVIIGGKIIIADNMIMEPVKQAVLSYTNRNISEDTEIKFSDLGQMAGIIGAPALAMEKIANEGELKK
ncbi:MAG: ROK family transcriptional regulator [Bacteroidota bacterium]